MTNFNAYAALAGVAAATIATTGHRRAVVAVAVAATWRTRQDVTRAFARPADAVAPAAGFAVPARKRTAVAASAAWNPPL
jgi:hypothetical protein